MADDMVLRVLMVDDDLNDVLLTEDALQRSGYTLVVQRVDTAVALDAALTPQAWDLIVCAYSMPTFNGLEAVALVRRRGLDVPFILMSGTVGEEIAVEALQAGADDFMLKSNLAGLGRRAQRAVRAGTERRLRQQAEARYRSLVETSPDAILLHDLHGVIQMANQQTAILYRYTSPEPLIGQQALELIVPADRARAAVAIQEVTGGAVLTTRIYTALRHDGTTFALELHATRVYADSAGGVDSIMIVARDVTSRQEAEARLIAERDLLQTLIDAIPDAIYVEDEQLRFLRVNLAQARILGAATPEELLGKTDFDYFPAELARQFGLQERQILATGQPKINELEDQSSLGYGERWILSSKVPLWQGGRIIGLVGVSRDITSLKLAEEGLVLAYDTTIEGWSRALDLRDKETEGHSQRVTERTLALAHAMGLSSAALVQVRRGALLHDIGKMGVPDAILLKPGPLTDEEWVVMRQHPVHAYDLLSPIEYLRPALAIPYCHHEKWDGSGYPRGLAGEQIPLSARIFAVVDVWDALLSDRPYRRGWSEERVRAHIAASAGTHFDPEVVTAFLAMDWPHRQDSTATTTG